VCYEVDNNGISPPQKYLSKEFLTRLTQIAPVVAINTMIREKKDRDSFMKTVKAVGGKKVSKYTSKCQDGDLNEVVVLSSVGEEASEHQRMANFKEIVKSFDLETGVWLSRKQSKLLAHVEALKLMK
jgi:ABC-type sugar transport system substrate-binding protein